MPRMRSRAAWHRRGPVDSRAADALLCCCLSDCCACTCLLAEQPVLPASLGLALAYLCPTLTLAPPPRPRPASECASCKGKGDVDMSTKALEEATGYNWDRKKIEWEEVPCPDGKGSRKMLGYAQ